MSRRPEYKKDVARSISSLQEFQDNYRENEVSVFVLSFFFFLKESKVTCTKDQPLGELSNMKSIFRLNCTSL